MPHILSSFYDIIYSVTALCNWYSIIETAKANNLDAYSYLKYILTQLPIYEAEQRDIEELLPWNVKLD
jgi:hypothetical protein